MVFTELPEGASVDLYTVTAEWVRRLEHGGAGTARWDVRDRTGQTVSSGAYVVVIRSPGGDQSVKKVLVLR